MTKKEKEKTIANYMQTLQLSREEAEELLLFDNDEIDNEEASLLEEKAEEVKKEQHFTEPPARYTEAKLIKED